MKRGYWRTKDGREIPIKELTDKHLLNIKKWIERKAEEGLIIEYGFDDGEEVWYDRDILFGEEAKIMLGYDEIREEIKRRGLE